MRASKLITLSAVAVLVGGTSLALGQGSLQSGSSMQRSSGASQGSVRGFQPKKSLGAHQKIASETRRLRLQERQGIGPSEKPGAYARGSARELESSAGPGLNIQQRSRLRDMVRDIPRVSSAGTDIRINAVVPKSVQMAAAPLPLEVQRMHPRIRQDRVFKYRDQIVVVNPATSRIVAIIKVPPKA
jgi:hypothetical protein